MQLRAWLHRCFLATVLAITLPTAGAAAEPLIAGQIKAAVVIGEVDAINHQDQSVTPLHNDDLLSQGFTVRTGEDASIVLVFSNGATLRLSANTEVSIDEFLQDPFPTAELALEKLTQEPTVSATKLRLARGEIVGHVIALRPGSGHVINTPVGAAGIRGTTFRHIFRPAANGSALFSSSTDEGEVAFTATDGQTAPISAATEITGRLRPGRRGIVFTSQEISRRAKVVIGHHVKVMQAVRARTRFSRADRPAAGTRPVVRRAVNGVRESTNDFKTINREEQDAIKQEQEKAKTPRPAKEKAAPKTPTPAKKKS